jgi:hypothetical protein
MGVGAAVVSADWVALTSLWEAPTRMKLVSICSMAESGSRRGKI